MPDWYYDWTTMLFVWDADAPDPDDDTTTPEDD